MCAATLAILLSGGCGVQGDWALKRVEPAGGNEDFTVARASFYGDHSFEALTVRDGRTVKAKGTYDYCACRDELTLHMGERTRVLRAFRKSCVRLNLRDVRKDGEPVTVVMRRVARYDRHAECRDGCCCPCD